jgi:large subunit ribosomal protein L9
VNDQGVLYGAVTQRDIADQLVADGFGVEFRAVRLTQTIRRIGHYSCTIQLDRDLKTDISIDVLPDRTLEILTAAADAPAEEPEAEEAPAAEAPAAEAEAKADGKKGKKAKA